MLVSVQGAMKTSDHLDRGIQHCLCARTCQNQQFYLWQRCHIVGLCPLTSFRFRPKCTELLLENRTTIFFWPSKLQTTNLRSPWTEPLYLRPLSFVCQKHPHSEKNHSLLEALVLGQSWGTCQHQCPLLLVLHPDLDYCTNCPSFPDNHKVKNKHQITNGNGCHKREFDNSQHNNLQNTTCKVAGCNITKNQVITKHPNQQILNFCPGEKLHKAASLAFNIHFPLRLQQTLQLPLLLLPLLLYPSLCKGWQIQISARSSAPPTTQSRRKMSWPWAALKPIMKPLMNKSQTQVVQ